MSIEEQQKDGRANPDGDKSFQHYYVKGLEIENVRCFGKRQRINFTDSKGNISQWTVILGDNATGKTTLLRSIVSMLHLPLSDEDDGENQKRYTYLRGLVDGWDMKHQDGEQESVLRMIMSICKPPFIEEKWPEIFVSNTYKRNHKSRERKFLTRQSYCFAYGANRRMTEKSLSDDSFTRISENLYKDDAFLPNSSEYFLRLDYETAKSRKGSRELDKVKELLLKVLPEGVQDIKIVKAGRLQREVQVKTDFGWVNLNDLSLGYKTTIAWLIDFATKMIYFHDKSDNPFDESAILVLDEIDLHMHPAWQRILHSQFFSVRSCQKRTGMCWR
ncbi:MAG: AAA family ATPase [Tannerella sp.]|nr:AAA family ATPase [Tannerella sp.]